LFVDANRDGIAANGCSTRATAALRPQQTFARHRASAPVSSDARRATAGRAATTSDAAERAGAAHSRYATGAARTVVRSSDDAGTRRAATLVLLRNLGDATALCERKEWYE
jgi:hypothetical protein